jgi:hypothetical protein
MINLASTSDLLELVTGSALTIHVHASWVDLSGSTVTPGRTNSIVTTATTTNVVPSPAAATQRNVKTVTIRNTDAASSLLVTVQHTDGTSLVQLVKITLLAGYTLTYNEGDGWQVLDQSGAIANSPAAGRLVKTTVLTSGSAASFTTGPSTNTIDVELLGGGGAGGGCTSLASAAGAAGGGGAGSYARKTFAVTPNTNYTYTVGAAGTGVSGAGGGNGTASTFAVGATTVTAPGGSGAPVATAATTLTSRAGGAGGAVATNGDINGSGAPGEAGNVLIVATPIVQSGNGGSTAYGAGGLGLVAVGAGNAAIGFGGGGGGAATGASTVRTGGNAGGGLIVVREYT